MTVRDINWASGAEVTSWTESTPLSGDRPVRTFNIQVCPQVYTLLRHMRQHMRQTHQLTPDRSPMLQGTPDQKAQALQIMLAGVSRYKELCEGRYCGACPASPHVCCTAADRMMHPAASASCWVCACQDAGHVSPSFA